VALVRTDVSKEEVLLRNVLQLLVTANAVPSSLILLSLMMKAIRSSETSVLTRGTRRNFPENDIFHGRRHENLKSYMKLSLKIRLSHSRLSTML
jgi:hypothetical protein